MKIFVTGASGYIGEAVVRALTHAKHEVIGLARSEDAARHVQAGGATPHRGDLAEPESFAGVAARCDAIVHAAFHPSKEGVAVDRLAIDAMLESALARRSPIAFVYTSGVWVLGNTGDRVANEDASVATPAKLVSWRPAHEKIVLEAATPLLATAVIRPGIVYGGKTGLVAAFFESATRDGAAQIVGEGANRWSFVHRDDLAELYRMVIERHARGIFHGVDGVPIAMRDAARAASTAAGKGGQTRSQTADEARRAMGGMADASCLDQEVGAKASTTLGWKPTRRSFIDAAAEAYSEWSG